MAKFVGTAFAALLIAGGLAAQPRDDGVEDVTAPNQPLVPLSEFFGLWRGVDLVENAHSRFFMATPEDLNVTIAPASRQGFTVAWITLAPAEEGDGFDRLPSRITFTPGGQPGFYQGVGSGDPLAGEAMNWARLDGRTLSVYRLTPNAGGGFELNSHERTLGPDGMTLEFRRIRDDASIRTLRGALVRGQE